MFPPLVVIIVYVYYRGRAAYDHRLILLCHFCTMMVDVIFFALCCDSYEQMRARMNDGSTLHA